MKSSERVYCHHRISPKSPSWRRARYSHFVTAQQQGGKVVLPEAEPRSWGRALGRNPVVRHCLERSRERYGFDGLNFPRTPDGWMSIVSAALLTGYFVFRITSVEGE